MAQTKSKALVIAAVLLLLGGTATVIVQQALTRNSKATTAAALAVEAVANRGKPPTAAATNAAVKVLVFRNVPSWNRNPDFEDSLSAMGVEHEVKPSMDMATIDLTPYRFVVIPGAQWKTDFYQHYAASADRFDRYVTNGGTLVLELNGAENDGIVLPRGVSMVKHGAKENTILVAAHPILTPLGGRPIRASYASHGYLEGLPADALLLAVESTDGQPDATKPTFVEYTYGTGRIIAACQCFHDRDRSGRGPLMETTLSYAIEKKWFRPKN